LQRGYAAQTRVLFAAMPMEQLQEAQALLEKGLLSEAVASANAALKTARSSADATDIVEAVRLLAKLQCTRGEHAAVDKLVTEVGTVKSGSLQDAVLRLSLAECALASPGADHVLEERARSCEEALQIFNLEQRKDLEADALLCLAGLYLQLPCSAASDRLRMSDKASKLARQSRVCSREIQDKRREALAMHTAAVTYASFGDEMVDAIKLERDALSKFKALGLTALHLLSLQCLASWHLTAREHAPALQCAEDAWELAKSMGERQKAETLVVLVRAYIANARIDEAIRVATKEAESFRASSCKREEATALLSLMYTYFADDDPDEALRVADDVLEVLQQLGDEKGLMQVRQAKAQCHLHEQELEEALKVCGQAIDISTPAATRQDHLLALHCAAFAHAAGGSVQAARESSQKLRAELEKVDVQAADAVAAVISADVSMLQGELNWASTSAMDAVDVLRAMESKREEAMGCRMVAKMYMASKDYYAALKMAERARWCCQAVDDKAQEAEALLLVAQLQSTVIAEDSLADDAESEAYKNAMAKALKAAEGAAHKAKKMVLPEVEAAAYAVRAQLLALSGDFGEAKAAALQAEKLFEEAEQPSNAAASKVILADVYLASGDTDTAIEIATEAVELFKQQEDEEGVAYARSCAQAAKARAQVPVALTMTDAMPMRAQGGARSQETALIAPTGPSKEMISARVKEIVARVVGIDDELVTIDTPLMEAGITSQTAIMLRNEMSKEMPGTSFPATLLFDFPTTGAIAALVMDSA